jgi:hypothetical protein
MLVSGACALVIGLLYGGNPLWLVLVCLVWGFAVIADSAQFSACISELSQTEYIGTALTLQTSLGFLLTIITIRLIPSLEGIVGWPELASVRSQEPAFAFLAIGPAIGVVAMYVLRRSPYASRLAGGRG